MISAPRMSELYWEPTRGGRVPFGVEGLIGGAYMAVGHSEQWIECCRAQLARGRDTRGITRAALVVALAITGSRDEAMAAANGLIDDAEATDNPLALSWALLTYGTAFQDSDPDRARHNLRRGWRSLKTPTIATTRQTWLPPCADSKTRFSSGTSHHRPTRHVPLAAGATGTTTGLGDSTAPNAPSMTSPARSASSAPSRATAG